MRLNSIKLAGFKSFAEPTHFQLPGQLVGVVGPNGCGKSNIMDAVRWVLGESKASELRGESMQDVIFNGSGQRKPAGRASVELVFANEDGRAGGPWSRFHEIAVKRVLTRDGASSYHINGQPVRRRDVQDVFLGTGLGPRAYAIIGQGTISRIIESRPEELRLFLEEAAGVSKYKERRRETESRLKETRENLTRVDDIRRELDSSLAKLEQQAEVAGRYREWQAAAEAKQQQLWFLKHRDAAAEAARIGTAIAETTTALEARLAELRRTEAELETLRQAHLAAGDALHAAQGALAEAALEVSRLEERIRYLVAGRQRVEARLAELASQRQGWAGQRDAAAVELARIGGAIDAAGAQAAALTVAAADAAGALPALEQSLRGAQADRSAQQAAVGTVQQQIQVLAAEGRSLQERRRQAEARLARLGAERRQLAVPDPDRLAALTTEATAAADAAVAAATGVQALVQQAAGLDAERRERQHDANAQGARQAAVGARLEALRALQDKVQAQTKLKPWLARHGLDGLAGLWSRIEVEAGWEAAFEAALRERLGALEVTRPDTLQAFAADPPPARLVFHVALAATRSAASATNEPGAPQPPTAAAASPRPRLVERLRHADVDARTLVGDWLGGVFTAPTLAAALAERASLAPGEVVTTPDGHTVSRFAVGFYAPDSEQAGLLARAREIDHGEREWRAQVLIADEARAGLVRTEAAAAQVAQQLVAARRTAAEAQARAHRLQVEALRSTQQADESRARHGRLCDELAEVDAQLAELEQRAAAGEARFEALDHELGAAQEALVERDDAVGAGERHLAEAREALRTAERRAQEAQFEARSLAARQAELERGLETAAQQLDANAAATTDTRAEAERLADASAEAGLQAALAVRLDREAALGARRSDYDDLSRRLRQADEARLAAEQTLPPLRDRIGRMQLDEQAARLGAQQHAEQLAAAGADLAALAQATQAGGVRLAGLQAEIDRLQRDVAALGAVNLAALDELTASRERKAFLDAQNADLTQAMTTLEDAIHRIDLETRSLLTSTFDQVNAHFGRMFPSLFGGGNARLVMTGEQILDAGVQVMAQPPGKKNASIHLLSGGEKALTAIALVFAIFQLNPAPFCLLDEVDAPLDDANTERYARLVKQMAEGTQFLFISHNRLAMEMAEQLIGVTMQEQGVSRIVAVDVEAAVGLTETA